MQLIGKTSTFTVELTEVEVRVLLQGLDARRRRAAEDRPISQTYEPWNKISDDLEKNLQQLAPVLMA